MQETQGTSVIKVKCEAITKAESEAFNAEVEAWNERSEVATGLEEEFTEEPPTLEPTILTTGEITLEWAEDSFV